MFLFVVLSVGIGRGCVGDGRGWQFSLPEFVSLLALFGFVSVIVCFLVWVCLVLYSCGARLVRVSLLLPLSFESLWLFGGGVGSD